MYLQIAWLRGGVVTLVTFVWLSSAVHFQMCSQMLCPRGNVTLFAVRCGEMSNKCNQCDYASSHPGHLRIHLKTHNGEKSNKTIKDGDIAPWTNWKDLNKKKGKGKNKGKEHNKEIEQDYISKWRGSSSVCLFFVSLRAFGAQVVRMLYVLLFFTILNPQTIFIY